MAIRILAVGLVLAAGLWGQKHKSFSWQDACFKNPAAPYCAGRDYAVKRPDAKAAAKEAAAYRDAAGNLTPSVIAISGVDWRFADPSADAIAGFSFAAMSGSPLVRGLVFRLGAKHGLGEAEILKVFDGLSGVDQIALSIRDNRIVAMVTGRVSDLTLPASEAGLKVAPVSANAILAGHADAVDLAVQRMAANGPADQFTSLANERHGNSEFWAVGLGGAAGPQALSAGIERFSLTAAIRNGLASDLDFEFNGAPGGDALAQLQTRLGAASIEGNVVHFRSSMEALADSPFGERLAALVTAGRYLPLHRVPDRTKPVIYGLDDGPKEVNQLPKH